LITRIIAAHKSTFTDWQWSTLLHATLEVLQELASLHGNIYAISFCDNGDLLSQWRGYGSMGGGYCIGFGPSRFRPADDPPPMLRRVFYDQKQQEAIVLKVLRLARHYLPRGNRSSRADSQILAMAHDVAMELFYYVSSFKDPSFAEEREWRLVYHFSDTMLKERLEFRASAAGIKPYVQVAITRVKHSKPQRLPIKVIRHGPSVNPTLAKHSIELLLQRAEYDRRRVLVCGSNVPYRS
jgi:hypothetical protein